MELVPKIYFLNEAAKILGTSVEGLSAILRRLNKKKVGYTFRLTDEDIAKLRKMIEEYKYE